MVTKILNMYHVSICKGSFNSTMQSDYLYNAKSKLKKFSLTNTNRFSILKIFTILLVAVSLYRHRDFDIEIF